MVSIFPCDVHGRRAPARLGSAYLTVARGTDKWSRKLRVCAPCLADILKTHEDEWTDLGVDDEVQVAEVCPTCQAVLTDPSERYGCFVTIYPRGDERQDFFAWYCPVDADSLARAYGLIKS